MPTRQRPFDRTRSSGALAPPDASRPSLAAPEPDNSDNAKEQLT